MMLRTLGGAALILAGSFFPAAAITYDVDIADTVNGDFTLTGTIETTAIGSFSAQDFDPLVSAFSLTLTLPILGAIVFDDTNSSWAGTETTVSVDASEITLTFASNAQAIIEQPSTSSAIDWVGGSIFGSSQLGAFFGDVPFPDGSTFATAQDSAPEVPLPFAAALLIPALAGLGLIARRSRG